VIQEVRMASPRFPSDAELDQIILGPDSFVWQRFGDIRLFFGSGYALLLQVAHPTVGSGVRDHSTFERDPWGRLLRTADYLFLIVYSGREAAAVGRRLRELHKTIKGTDPDGSRYSALEPEAYAWVHATLIDAPIRAHERFLGPLDQDEIEQIYAEMLPVGRLLGVREGDLPADWAGFCEYFDEMVAERLERHQTVDTVLRAMTRPTPPPVIDRIPGLWPALRLPPSRALRTATIGLLPPVLRKRFGLRWSGVEAAEFRALGAASRAVGPLLPRTLRHAGPAYLRWRDEAIAAGPLGPGAGSQRPAAARPVVRPAA
jgi:uncharacterized protein (DUF2236 family)